MTIAEARVLPPPELMSRVAGTDSAEWFVKSGGMSVQDVRAALAAAGRPLEEFNEILDFGCGCGRILTPMLNEIGASRITGVDIDDEAMGWLRTQHPDVPLRTVDPLPPLPFQDNTFDLVYCHSVFTHMDRNYQDRWLAELKRVTMPGATLVVSFSGAEAFQKLTEQWISVGADPQPLIAAIQTEGTLFIEDDGWKNGPFPDFYHSMFHAEWYVRKHWGTFFSFIQHLPKGSLAYQDFVVLQTPKKQEAPAANTDLPFPPENFRRFVGPVDTRFFDNPSGELVFPEVSADHYQTVFDFGCGCGRIARQLLQQKVRPKRYVGIDIHRGMIAWDRETFSAVDPRFQFLVHDVFNLGLAPENKRRTFAPFPVGAGEFTLVNAHSVFTHILQEAAVLYLAEISRILTSQGVARTTWFFFEKSSFPWLEPHQVSLFVNEVDPTNAVIYDRHWFVEAVRAAGMRIAHTVRPSVPGHQWTLFLKKNDGSASELTLLRRESDEWLCGALGSGEQAACTQIDELSRRVQELDAEKNQIFNSWSWRVTQPLRRLARLWS
jgi:SAM-dependent methyltransferase